MPVLAFPSRSGIDRLVISQFPRHSGSDEAMTVHAPEAVERILLGQALAHHGPANLVRNPDTGCARAEDNHSMLSQRRATDANRRDRGRERDGAGALHIVVERADEVAVLLEDAPSVCGCEVLPLQKRVWEQRGHRLDVSMNEGIVALPANSRVP